MSITLKIKDIILKEDYHSQKELEKLTVDIIKAYIKKYITLYMNSGERPKLTLFYPFKNINRSSYSTIQTFLIDFKLKLVLESSFPKNGEFMGTSSNAGLITLRFDDNLYGDSLNKFIKETDNIEELVRDIYYNTYDKSSSSTLLHELQHAYDYFRSGGKYTSDRKSKKYYNDLGPDNNTQKASSPEKLEINRNSYANLKHEVEARFTQAMEGVLAYKYGEGGVPEPRSLRDFVDEVISNFKWMDRMTPTIKKYLYRKASNYYHHKIEELKNSI